MRLMCQAEEADSVAVKGHSRPPSKYPQKWAEVFVLQVDVFLSKRYLYIYIHKFGSSIIYIHNKYI